MKRWPMIQNYVALNTTFKKFQKKQATLRSASGKDKQLDCVLTDKRSRKYGTDAEVNDMTHLESDHRSVTAQFDSHAEKKKRKAWKTKKARTESVHKYKIREILYIKEAT